MPCYREFLRMLNGQPGRATLFEPFPDKKLISQLIWRSGDHLWCTTQNTVMTLIDYYAYLKSDVVVIDVRSLVLDEVLACSASLPDEMKFVILSDDPETLAAADTHDAVCALATTGRVAGRYAKPLILIEEDFAVGIDSLRGAVNDGFAGVYTGSHAEEFLALRDEMDDKIALLGGLGADYINHAAPLAIHSRVKALHDAAGGGWAVGTGQIIDSHVTDNQTLGGLEYLGFISMLGIYNKLI